MGKKAAIVFLFVLLFAGCWGIMYRMTPKALKEEAKAQASQAGSTVSDNVYRYSAADITSGCALQDGILCAIEQMVKCTMAPELNGCTKEAVPSFVLGKTEEAVRPTEMSFKVVKIKPIIESNDIAVYTESDCDAMWFGLCKGKVIYTLSQREGKWVVLNVYAME